VIQTQPIVPDSFEENEILIRMILSPFHIDKKDATKITHTAFRPPPKIDEVSVNRLNFTNAIFCKQQGKAMNSATKTFCGLASIRHSVVIQHGAFVRISKQPNNPSHADIYYGIVLKKGESAPAEINLILKELARSAHYYPDRNLDSDVWEGGDVSEC
jgi:hypothetical protein